MRQLIIFIFLSTVLFSCEKVITLDLKTTAPVIVIEGSITNQEIPYTVKISRTTDYFNPGVNPEVSGATVQISDNIGHSETLIESSPGIYITQSILGTYGVTYNLNVKVDGKEYTATSTMPELTLIDSITINKSETVKGGMGGHKNSNISVHCFFQDKFNVKEYYRIKPYQNGIASDNINIMDDNLNDGQHIDYSRIRSDFVIGDTVKIDLIKMDKLTYDYFLTLNDILGRDLQNSSTPYNPLSNISNGAMGYFGAVAIDTKKVIIN